MTGPALATDAEALAAVKVEILKISARIAPVAPAPSEAWVASVLAEAGRLYPGARGVVEFIRGALGVVATPRDAAPVEPPSDTDTSRMAVERSIAWLSQSLTLGAPAAAEQLRALLTESHALKEDLAKLTDPAAVRANILRGTIAKPDDLVFLHDTNGPVAAIEADRDALLAALGWKPGPLGEDGRRDVILKDAACLRPAMVRARQEAQRAEGDAQLWHMHAADWHGSGGGLLAAVWGRLKKAEAEVARRRVPGALPLLEAARRVKATHDRLGWTTDAALAKAKHEEAVLKLCAVLEQAAMTPNPEGSVAETARPESEWHEDMGDVMWWCFPVEEAPYVGSPLDTGLTVTAVLHDQFGQPIGQVQGKVGGWPGYHTHFTPLPTIPVEPPPVAGVSEHAQTGADE